MPELMGPANTPGSSTTRPSDARVFSTADRWYRACSSADADDGTQASADDMNAILGQLRNAIRGMGVTVDNTSDDMLFHAVQLAQVSWAVDSGAADAAVATFAPALTAATLLAGRVMAIKWSFANATTTPTLNPNGLGAKVIVNRRGGALAVGDIAPGRVDLCVYDGTNIRMLTFGARTRVVYNAAGTYSWVCPTGVTQVDVELWGAGASGWNSTIGPLSTSPGGTDGPGGCSGGYARKRLAVVPGTTYTLTVGAGGIAPTTAVDNGGSGGSTSFGSLLSATGGAWGSGAANSPGVGVGGTENLTGGVGLAVQNQSGTAGFNGVYGYGAAAPRGGATQQAHTVGNWPGGGGGGGDLTTGSGGAAPGNGAAGGIILEY